MGSIPIIRSIKKGTLSGALFYGNNNGYGNRTGGQTAQENSKNIAVVVDSIVCCHTAPACRRAIARVRGIPIIRSNIQKAPSNGCFFILDCTEFFNYFELIL